MLFSNPYFTMIAIFAASFLVGLNLRLDPDGIILHYLGNFKRQKRANDMFHAAPYDSLETGNVAVQVEMRHKEARIYMVSARCQWLVELAEGFEHGNIAAFINRCDLNPRRFRNALSGQNYLQMEDAISISKELGMPTGWIFEGETRGCSREFIDMFTSSSLLRAYLSEAEYAHRVEDETREEARPDFKKVRESFQGQVESMKGKKWQMP